MLKQTIYLATHINESEKLKSLAIFHHNTINTHYFNALELAKYLLQLSGVTINKTFISNDDIAAALYKDIKKIKYFEKFTLNDILGLIDSVNDLRSYIVTDEEKEINDKLPPLPFEEKNKAIKEVYHLMQQFFKENNLIDEVGLIRYALDNTKTFSNINFINVNDKYPLHIALLNKASGGNVQLLTYEDKPLKIASYVKGFGQTNEVENILRYIYDNKIPFDQCLVAAAETKDYANIFTNYRDVLGLPITIGTGTIVLETRPGKLFSIINDWIDNFYNTEYLKNIIYDESFNLTKLKETLMIPEDDFEEINKSLEYPEIISLDSIITTVGDMKLTFDERDNNKKLDEYYHLLCKYEKEGFNKENTIRRKQEYEYVARFVNELSLGFSQFFEKYVITNDAKDKNALGKILKCLFYHFTYGVSYEDIKKTIFAQNVGRESIKENSLYFTSIDNALSCLRPYLFIVGLSSNNFPGMSKEDPVLLDEDYEAFDVNKASNRNIINNKETFFRLLDEANKEDVSIHLSYAFYNSQSLKEQNASSVIFESYKKENGLDKTVEDFEMEFKKVNQTKYKFVEFFDSGILPISSIGNAVVSNKKVSYEKLPVNNDEASIDLTKLLRKPRGFSASSVTNYAHCPYLFYLKDVLRIEQEEDVDIYQVIPANEWGTLAHYLLETLDKNVVTTKEDFGLIASQRFEEYLIMHKPINTVLADLEKNEFVEMMENAYEMESNYKTLFREEDIVTTHKESGIRIHGFPDKVIENINGTVRVVDYKTGKSIKHYSYDAASMIQCTMYAYIIEQTKKRTVAGFEYWYLRHKYIVYSNDNEEMMMDHYKNLTDTLLNLKKSLTTGVFTPNTDHCSSCYYRNICMKGKKK